MLYSLKCFNNPILMVAEKQAVSINLRENIDKAAGEMVFNINCYMCPSVLHSPQHNSLLHVQDSLCKFLDLNSINHTCFSTNI